MLSFYLDYTFLIASSVSVNIAYVLTDINISFNKYRLLHGHFHIGLVIIPRHPYWLEMKLRDDNQANMEMPMY